jgi:hypothetical protein
MKVFLVIAMLFVTSGVAKAQQYGIGQFERVQILSDELRDVTWSMYLLQERQWPQTRADAYITRQLHRLHYQAANFENQVDNFDNRDRIELEYRRLLSTYREVRYMLDRTPYGGYVYGNFRTVGSLINRIGRNLYGDQDRPRDYDRDGYDFDYDDDDFDYENYDDYDD